MSNFDSVSDCMHLPNTPYEHEVGFISFGHASRIHKTLLNVKLATERPETYAAFHLDPVPAFLRSKVMQ